VEGIELKIEGMSCEHCVARTEKALAAVTGVNEVEVRLEPEPGVATVTGENVNLDDLINAVDQAGFTASAS
jgi:copper chaperone CopZ